MYESEERTAGTLPALRKDLEYIPVCSDPRGIDLPRMRKEGAILKEIHIRIEREDTLFQVMEKFMYVIGTGCCLGMVYVLARLAGVF